MFLKQYFLFFTLLLFVIVSNQEIVSPNFIPSKRNKILSRYGRAVLSRYGKRSFNDFFKNTKKNFYPGYGKSHT
uniref:Uncharacterized protein n=1 Tax=Parastrongyloides trichosuri TaxID=131310 RepID=A0A0N4ZU79_PARTI